MKTIIVSDLHLHNYFEPEKYIFLKNLFNSADKLIINGDLWSIYSSTFNDFINSNWSLLFPLMRQKQTVYLYGNHDCREYMDERINKFCRFHYEKYEINVGNKRMEIRHGHQFFKRYFKVNQNMIDLKRLLKLDYIFRYPAEHLIYKCTNVEMLIKYFKFLNNQIKYSFISKYDSTKYYVTGHTHLPEIDFINHYINTGFIGYGFASYLEINNNKFELKFEHY